MMGRNRKFSKFDLFKETNKLILMNGYEGFTISNLAENLSISRAAIYKYYPNKDELLMDFMIHEMTKFLDDLKKVDTTKPFMQQLEHLLTTIFRSKDLHQILGVSDIIPNNNNAVIIQKKEQLANMHRDMYHPLIQMVELGKVQHEIDNNTPNEIILGFIFQSINIPNYSQIDEKQFLQHVKRLILHGIKGENR